MKGCSLKIYMVSLNQEADLKIQCTHVEGSLEMEGLHSQRLLYVLISMSRM